MRAILAEDSQPLLGHFSNLASQVSRVRTSWNELATIERYALHSSVMYFCGELYIASLYQDGWTLIILRREI